jgi:hypothetical protein
MVTWDEYVPSLEDQALIDKLEIMIIHQLRWGSIYSLLQNESFDLVAEALICNMALGGIIRPGKMTEDERDVFFARMYIYLLGWKLAPCAFYRRDNPPKGKWSTAFFDWPSRFQIRYPIVCDLILKRSEAELLRD